MTRYEIDSGTITFDARTSLHPVVAIAPASGWFEAEIVDGLFVPGSTLAGALEIEVDAIKSGNPLYDAETRRRIDAGAHPKIRGEITGTTGVEEATAVIEGTVDFHGEEVLLEGEVTLVPGPALTGRGTVDIRWWGLQPPRLLAFRVEPEVLINVELPLAEEA